MRDNSISADSLMLQAVSIIGRARSLKGISRIIAIKELKKGALLMNDSIALEPENIQNRLIRLRHLLGATMRSPKKFYIEVEEDLTFLKEKYSLLSTEEKVNYLSAFAEYRIFKGDKERGMIKLKEAVAINSDSFIGQYASTLLEKLSNNCN